MKTLEITGREEMEAVIARCGICFVGMADTDGTPYVIPMNFGYENGSVYLHSAPDGRSIDILRRNPRVCLTFATGHELVFQHPEVACSYSMRSESVLAWGKVNFIEDMQQKREALNILMRHYADRPFVYSDPAVKNVKVWKVTVDTLTCKAFGRSPREKE